MVPILAQIPSLGPYLVKDVLAGANGAEPRYLTAVGDAVFFRASDGSHGNELWKSDGTPGGTLMVRDINPGSDGSTPLNLTPMSDTLYFAANDGSHGYELWKSDGSLSGTVTISDVHPGIGSASPGWLTPVGDTLYFKASDGYSGPGHGEELWSSDGTPTGTLLVRDIHTERIAPDWPI